MNEPKKLRRRQDIELVPLTLEHAPNMYRWMCDPTVSSNIGLRSEPTLEKTIEWISKSLNDPSTKPFAVLLAGRHVGNVVIDRIDNYLGTARLSVYIGDCAARGTGVGLTAIYHTLVEGFERMALNKVWLTVHCRNFAAINTYAQLRFVVEGILRDEFWLDGERIAVFYMALLRDDFERLVFE